MKAFKTAPASSDNTYSIYERCSEGFYLVASGFTIESANDLVHIANLREEASADAFFEDFSYGPGFVMDGITTEEIIAYGGVGIS